MPPDDVRHRLLVVSGSTRAASTNSALCRTAVVTAPSGVDVETCLDVSVLPHFDPDADREPLPPAVQQLRDRIAAADAVLFCTPEYAGTLPGSFKNLLDGTVGGTQLNDKPVGWVKAAADSRRGEGAHATLATVLGYVQAHVVADACRHVPVARESVGPDGFLADPVVHAGIADAITTLLTAAGR